MAFLLDDLVKAMGAGGMSKGQVSRLCLEIDAAGECLPPAAAGRHLALSLAGRDLSGDPRRRQDREPRVIFAVAVNE